MTTPGITLLERVTDQLSVYGGTPMKAWEDFVSPSGNEEYQYWEAAAAYDNLTAEQMGLVETFLRKHAGDPLAVANLARAAYDAGTYPSNGYLLTNLNAMYSELQKFDRSCPYDEFEYPHLNIYRVVSGIKGDINELPMAQRRGLIAAAQFTLTNFLSESIDYNLIDSTRSAKEALPNESIWLQDSTLRDFLNWNPSKVEDVLDIKADHPKLGVAALIAIIEGEIAPPLISGCL
jgi:hypothetical protein